MTASGTIAPLTATAGGSRGGSAPLAVEGVAIVSVSSADEMTLAIALVEVIEYAESRSFLIRVCMSAAPDRLLEAVEIAEDLLDSPDQLGLWADDAAGLWRGLAITDR